MTTSQGPALGRWGTIGRSRRAILAVVTAVAVASAAVGWIAGRQSLAFRGILAVELDKAVFVEETEVSKLSVTLNGRAVLQIRIVAAGGEVRLHGAGWIDPDPALLLREGETERVEYANYAQYGSADREVDELSFDLQVSESIEGSLSVRFEPDSHFLVDRNPASIVELVLGDVVVDADEGKVIVDYTVRSERADTVEMDFDATEGITGQANLRWIGRSDGYFDRAE